RTNKKFATAGAPSPAREARALPRFVAALLPKRKSPAPKAFGTGFWRRPTLARPIAVLPSGLQRFTAVFGMGTGGATALVSPEIYAVLVGTNFWCVIRDSRFETRGSESFRRITIHDSRISIHQRFTVHSVKELPIL